MRWSNSCEYAKIFASTLVGLPAIIYRYLSLVKQPCNHDSSQFIGLSLQLDRQWQSAIEDMVAELGVQQLLIRIPVWDADNVEHYVHFMEQFPQQQWLVNILQNRESVENPALWKRQLRMIFSAIKPVTTKFWIGNAINRSKWGCRHCGDYLRLQECVEELRTEFPDLFVLGSSVIDFDPLVWWRTLWNRCHYQLQANAALLYVDRRLSPYNRQLGVFDLESKLRLVKAMTGLSNRCDDKLWICETNWPLLNTKPYTPNSGDPTCSVDEPTQAQYLKWYYKIAWQSGWVERVYWWQLINPGYGLVDSRGGKLRKMPSYYAFQSLISGELCTPLDSS